MCLDGYNSHECIEEVIDDKNISDEDKYYCDKYDINIKELRYKQKVKRDLNNILSSNPAAIEPFEEWLAKLVQKRATPV